MPTQLAVSDFLSSSEKKMIIDVRSPSEFTKGHIVGAVNIPLFDDNERAIVGTIYKQVGKHQAVVKGLEFVAPKMATWVKQVEHFPEELYLYCFRGGMRSNSLAWLFEQSGKKCFILEGGYKAFRNYVLNSFQKTYPLIILGGKTGCGKTEILECLQQAGEQIIDLEFLANHRGSAFGGIGKGEQPTTEMFENQLFYHLELLDNNKPIWIEDESRTIGKVIIPTEFFNQIRTSRTVFIDFPLELRIETILNHYGHYEISQLCDAISKITKRLGYDKAQEALQYCKTGNLNECVKILLYYYDNTYEKGKNSRNPSLLHSITFETLDMDIIVKSLQKYGQKNAHFTS